jgi:hypothetical protein
MQQTCGSAGAHVTRFFAPSTTVSRQTAFTRCCGVCTQRYQPTALPASRILVSQMRHSTVVAQHQRFEGTCYFHIQGNNLQHYTIQKTAVKTQPSRKLQTPRSKFLLVGNPGVWDSFNLFIYTLTTLSVAHTTQRRKMTHALRTGSNAGKNGRGPFSDAIPLPEGTVGHLWLKQSYLGLYTRQVSLAQNSNSRFW